MTTARQTERLDSRGAVERLGDRRAPVHHERVQLFVRDGEPSHVIDVARAKSVGVVVDASKEQGLVANRQLVEAVQRGAHDNVTLDEVTRAAHVRHGRTITK